MAWGRFRGSRVPSELPEGSSFLIAGAAGGSCVQVQNLAESAKNDKHGINRTCAALRTRNCAVWYAICPHLSAIWVYAVFSAYTVFLHTHTPKPERGTTPTRESKRHPLQRKSSNMMGWAGAKGLGDLARRCFRSRLTTASVKFRQYDVAHVGENDA